MVPRLVHMARMTTSDGNAIRLHRELAGWNLAQLAERVRTSRNYLTKIERGHAQASPALLKRIADELGVPTRDIVKVNTPTPA